MTDPMAEFEEAYAEKHGLSVAAQRAMNIWPVHCHCGCGWYFMAQDVESRGDGATSVFPVPLSDSHEGVPHNRHGAYSMVIRRSVV